VNLLEKMAPEKHAQISSMFEALEGIFSSVDVFLKGLRTFATFICQFPVKVGLDDEV